MYGVATFRMSAAIDFTAIDWLPRVTLAIALVAWTATFAGLLHLGITAVIGGRRPRAQTG
jgi:hypothetical protein